MLKHNTTRLMNKSFSLSLYGIYYLFIGLILVLIFSPNQKELLQVLEKAQWPAYLALCGGVIGIYFSFSAWLSCTERFRSNQPKRFDWNVVGYYVEMIGHMIWILLPFILLSYALTLRNTNHNLVIFVVVFALGFAVKRRNKLSILDGIAS